jgi:hypothetical protein
VVVVVVVVENDFCNCVIHCSASESKDVAVLQICSLAVGDKNLSRILLENF